jgi:hypothetical protein
VLRFLVEEDTLMQMLEKIVFGIVAVATILWLITGIIAPRDPVVVGRGDCLVRDHAGQAPRSVNSSVCDQIFGPATE